MWLNTLAVLLIASGSSSSQAAKATWVIDSTGFVKVSSTWLSWTHKNEGREQKFNLDPCGFLSWHHWDAGWVIFWPPTCRMKDELWLRKRRQEQIPLILSRALTGLRVEAPGKTWRFLRVPCSIFKMKLDLPTVISLNSGSPWGTILNGRGGAHAYLHVSEIWNGHDSHFRDVTPLESIEGIFKHIKHCSWKACLLLEGKKTQHSLRS